MRRAGETRAHTPPVRGPELPGKSRRSARTPRAWSEVAAGATALAARASVLSRPGRGVLQRGSVPLCAPKTRAATRESTPAHCACPRAQGRGGRGARAGRTRRGPSRAAGTGGSSLAQAAASTRGAGRHMAAPHAQTAAPRPKRVAPGKRLRASVLPAPAAGGRCGACAHRSSRGQKPRAVAGGGAVALHTGDSRRRRSAAQPCHAVS